MTVNFKTVSHGTARGTTTRWDNFVAGSLPHSVEPCPPANGPRFHSILERTSFISQRPSLLRQCALSWRLQRSSTTPTSGPSVPPRRTGPLPPAPICSVLAPRLNLFDTSWFQAPINTTSSAILGHRGEHCKVNAAVSIDREGFSFFLCSFLLTLFTFSSPLLTLKNCEK